MLRANLSNLIRNITNWLRRFPWLAGLVLMVVLLAIVVPFFIIRTELSIRATGLILQVLGLATAGFGIRDMHRMFGKPTLLGSVRNWWRAHPRTRPKLKEVTAEGTLVVSIEGRATVWKGAGEAPTVESRLKAIESNLLSLKERTKKLESSIRREVGAMHEQVTQERTARSREDSEIRKELETASTDGLHLASVGLVWLALGVTLTSIPRELLSLVVR